MGEARFLVFISAALKAVMEPELDYEPDLAGPALRAFTGLSKVWKLTVNEQAKLLGLTDPTTLRGLMASSAPTLTREMLERISHLLAIYRAINTLLPNQDRADAWMRAPKPAEGFGGCSALELMTSGKLEDLLSPTATASRGSAASETSLTGSHTAAPAKHASPRLSV